MAEVSFSYAVPAVATWQQVRTFTFDGPAVIASMCVQWANIGCCRGVSRVRTTFSGLVSTLSVSTGSSGGQHFQSGIGTSSRSAGAGRAVADAVYYDAYSAECGGARVEVKVCITLSDFIGSNQCVCTGTCGGNSSYVDITS